MKKTLVYDWPLRILHGVFIITFVIAFSIGKFIDDESPVFAYHMLAGFVLFVTLILRVIWGFVGSQYSKFSSFDLNPLNLVSYLKNAFFGKTQLAAGHNPASSWAGLLMIFLGIGVGISGFLASQYGRDFKEAHEVMVHLLLFISLAHIAGILLHKIKHKDPIGLSMVNGYKNGDLEGIPSSMPIAGMVVFLIIIGWSGYVVSNYNSGTQTVQFFGSSFVIGEADEQNSRLEEHEEELKQLFDEDE